MNNLKSRVKEYCNKKEIHEDHIAIYLNALLPDAIANNESISDEQIANTIACQELFWGLGSAISNYLQWEKAQF